MEDIIAIVVIIDLTSKCHLGVVIGNVIVQAINIVIVGEDEYDYNNVCI